MRNKVKANEDKLMWESFNETVHHEADEFDMAGQTGLGPLDDKPDLSIPPRRDREDDSEYRLDTAFKQAMEALSRTASQGGNVSIKSFDKESESIVLSTGGEKSIIIKIMGFEDDHDIPVSLRPDKHPQDEPGMGPEYRVRSDEPAPFGYGRD